jgi:hypothetical protein
MQILAIDVWVDLFSQGADTRPAALIDVGCELEGWEPLAAVNTLHGLAILHDLLELLHSIVLLLQDSASSLHFLQGRR